MRSGQPKLPAPSNVHGCQRQRYPRTSADTIKQSCRLASLGRNPSTDHRFPARRRSPYRSAEGPPCAKTRRSGNRVRPWVGTKSEWQRWGAIRRSSDRRLPNSHWGRKCTATNTRTIEPMSSGERRHHNDLKLVVFGSLLAAAIAIYMISLQRGDLQSSAVAGASGMARPHPPLDRAPGQPLQLSPLIRQS